MTTRTLQILLALADGPLHGYGIRQSVMDRTKGAVVLGSGTLYEAVDRLLARAWIAEVSTPPGEAPSGGPPRRYYALQPAGRTALVDELRRMEALVRYASAKDLLEGG